MNVIRNNLLQMILIVAIGISANMLFWAMLPASYQENESTDYFNYYEPVARNIIAGRGLIIDNDVLAILRPPLFPIILAGVFGLAEADGMSESVILQIFLLICGVLGALFVYGIARQFLTPWFSLISALLWIVYPPALWMIKQPNSEALFSVIFFASVLTFWIAYKKLSLCWLFATGVLTGLAALVRPIAIATAIPLLILLLFNGKWAWRLRILASLILLLSYLLTIFPWELWVYKTTDKVILLSEKGVPSVMDGIIFAIEDNNYREPIWMPPDVKEWMQVVEGFFIEKHPSSFTELLTILIPEIKRDPISFLELLAIKAARSWYGSDSQRLDTITMLVQLPFLALILWGTLILWRAGGFTKTFTIGTWLIVFYYWGMTIMVLSILRYMVPVIGLLFCLIPGVFRYFYMRAITTRLVQSLGKINLLRTKGFLNY